MKIKVKEKTVVKKELPVQEIGNEIEPGMTKHFFPAEVKRFVAVNRWAIQLNSQEGANHPTCVVVDENGEAKQFHAVILRGPSALRYSEDQDNDLPFVHLVTTAAIEGYLDPAGDRALEPWQC